MSRFTIGRRLGPVYDLPLEVLEEIFVQCAPFFPTLSYDVAPLLLVLVCSSWRDVVLNSSRLWSRVAIDMIDLVPKFKGSSGSRDLEISAIEFLKRSRNQALSLQLTGSLPSLFDNSEWEPGLNCLLNQVQGRVSEFSLSSPRLSKLFYSLNSGAEFPQLSNIRVSSSAGSSFDFLPFPLTIFSRSTQLKTVIYDAYISYETALNLAVPWEQLTRIVLTNVDYSSWNYIFPRCLNMQSGSFVISGSPPSSTSSTTEITLPYLTSLVIRSMQSSRSPLRLEGYSFPNLKDLTLEWNHSPGFDPIFLSTVKRLETLAISSPQYHLINMAEVLSILSLTPFISQLHVLNDHCSRELFDALTYHAYQQWPLIPHLRILQVETPHRNSICDEEPMLDALKKMVGSRWWIFPSSRVRQLEVLRMVTAKHNFVGIQEALEHLVNGGLQLDLYASVFAKVELGKQCHDQH